MSVSIIDKRKEKYLLDVIAREKKDFSSNILLLTLRSASLLYRIVYPLHRFLTHKHQRRLPVFTISIGNITVGGTGKTPFSIFLANHLHQMGKKIGVITKGYKKERKEEIIVEENKDFKTAGDEAVFLKNKLPFAHVISTNNMTEGGKKLINLFDIDVLLLDDAFQFISLYRDIDIVLIDLINPFGFRRLLPSGLLRESIKSLKRADLIVLTRCECLNDTEINNVKQEIKKNFSSTPMVLVNSKATKLLNISGDRVLSPEIIIGEKIVLVSGIGNPKEFEMMFEKYTSDIYSFRFTDHYKYTIDDIKEIESFALRNSANYIVTTYKDFFRLPRNFNYRPEWCILDIDIEIKEGQEIFRDLIGLVD